MPVPPDVPPTPPQRMAECVAQELREELVQIRAQLDQICPTASKRLWQTLQVYSKPFEFRILEGIDREAAFIADEDNRRLEFNILPIVGVYRRIVKSTTDRQLRRDLGRAAIEELVMHELYHVGCNLLRHSDVRVISRAASPLAIGAIDLSADTVATQWCAAVDCYREQGQNWTRLLYHWHMLSRLMIMLQFWVPQVGSPATKPQKRLRFFGLVLMAARLLDAIETKPFLEPELPLDSPLLPLIDFESGTLSITILPDWIFWLPPVGVNMWILTDLLAGLDTRPAAESINAARTLLWGLGKLPEKKQGIRKPGVNPER